MQQSLGHTSITLRVFFACLLSFNIFLTPIAAVAAAKNQRSNARSQKSVNKENGSSKAAANDVFAKPLETKAETNLPRARPEPAPLPLAPPMFAGDIAATMTATIQNDDGDTKIDPNPGTTETINYTATLASSGAGGSGLSFSNPLDSHTTLVPGSLNSTPVAFDRSENTNEDNAVSVTIQGQDPDGSNLTFVSISAPASGSLSVWSAPSCTAAGICSQTATYTPNANFFGSDSFNFRVNDGTANSNETGVVSITVVGVNDAPTFVVPGNPAAVNEDAGAQSVSNFITGVRPAQVGNTTEDGQTVSFVITNNTNTGLFSSGPTLNVVGAAYPKTATLTYTPAANQNGTAVITYHAHDTGGTANSGVEDSADQTFTITVNAVNDPPVVTPPAAYAVMANMKRTGLTGLLGVGGNNVTDADTGVNGCTPTPFTVKAGSISATSPVGGTVSNLNLTNGTFDFDPPPGATGVVTFTYVVSDNGCPGVADSSLVTVTVNVSGPVIWFVSPPSAAPAAGGDGRLSSPFNRLDQATTAMGASASQRIFVFKTAFATIAGQNVSLQGSGTQAAAQWLIGQGAVTGDFDAFMGITPPANTIARPVMSAVPATANGNRPIIQGQVTLRDNCFVTGFNLNVGAGLKGLTNGSIAAGSVLTIKDINVTSTNAAAVDFSSAQTVNYTASDLTNSTNVLVSGTGTALRVDNTTIGASGFTFKSITATAATNGIFLKDTGTVGFLNVYGDGSNTAQGGNFTGGTISSNGSDGTTAGVGVYLNNTRNITLRRMRLQNCQNFGIFGINVTALKFEYSTVDGANGTNIGFFEDAIQISNLFGTAAGDNSFTNDVIKGGRRHNLFIGNSTGTSASAATPDKVTITGSLIRDTSTTVDGNDNVHIRSDNPASLAISGNIKVDITNCTFAATNGDHIQTIAADNSKLTIVATGNALSGGGGASALGQGITISGGNATPSDSTETVRFNISNNGTVATPMTGTIQGGAININQGSGNGNWQGQVSNNVIGSIGVACSGSTQSSGIRLENHSKGTLTGIVSGNTVNQTCGAGGGISISAGDNTASGLGNGPLNATVTNNIVDVGNPTSGGFDHGIVMVAGNLSGNSNQVCYDLLNNTSEGSHVVGSSGFAYRTRQRFGSTVFMPGYAGAARTAANVITYQSGRPNTAIAGDGGTFSVSVEPVLGGGYQNTPGGAACTQPTVPAVGALFNERVGDQQLAENVLQKPATDSLLAVLDTEFDFISLLETRRVPEQTTLMSQPVLLATVSAEAFVEPPAPKAGVVSLAANSLKGIARTIGSMIEPTAHAETTAAVSNQTTETKAKQPELGNQRTEVRLNHTAKTEVRNQRSEIKANHATRESRGLRSEARNHSTTALTAFEPTPIGSFPINGTGPATGFTLPAGKTTTITFRATLNAPPALSGVPPATPKVSAQGTLTGAFVGNPLLTDDTTVVGADDPTVTNVDLYDSTTTVVSSANPSNTSQSVTFTATIGTSGTPNGSATARTGTVNFKDNGTSIPGCNSQPVSSNQATCTTSSLSTGSHPITADYSGDGNFDPSTAALSAAAGQNGTPQVVNKSGTNATLISSLNPATVTQNITFTVTISSATSVPGPPTGTVTFKDGVNPISCSNVGGQVLNGSGVATCQTSSLSATSHTITADYPGDANFNVNNGIALTASGGQNGHPQVVNKATPSVTLLSSLNPAFVGQTVTFTGTVAAPGGISGTPSGSLTFKDGAATITCSNVGGQTLNGSGVGTCQVSNLSAGNHTITVDYGGDSSFNVVNGTALTAGGGQNGNPQVINQSNTTMTVASSLNPSKVTESVTFTVNIISSNLGAVPGPPTGQVKFWDGPANTGTQIGATKTLVSGGTCNANSACVDSDATTSLTAGTHTITVEYLGDSNFTTNSANLSGGQVVNKSDTTTTITSDNPDSSNVGQNVDIVAQVVSTGVAFTNTGTVLFKDGSNTIAGCSAVPIVAGDATCSTTALPAGTRSLTAVYSGDATFNTSTSVAEPHQVGPVCPNSVTVTSNADSLAGTLRQALIDVCDGGTISFDTAGTFATPQTIDFATALANIAKNVTVNGPGAANLTVQRSFAGGTGNFSVFTIDSGFTVTITGMTIKNGSPAGDGGGVNNSGTLNLTNITVQSNTAAGQGGGIFNAAAGTLTLTNSTVSNNTSTSNGAGVFSAGVLNVVGSTISSNTSPIDGGGIAFVSAGPALTITNSTISGNNAAGSGGGLFVNGGTATLTGVTVTGNHCDSDDNTLGDGGGIQRQSGTVTLQDTIVAGNLKGSGKQIETVTVSGGPVANGGDILVKVTAAGVNGGATQTLTVALLSGETNAQVATKIQTALQGNASINNFFDITTNSADVVLKAKAAATNDPTMHVSIVASETGINSAESVHTTPGNPGALQKETLTVSGGPVTVAGDVSVTVAAPGPPAMNNTPINFLVAVAVNDTDIQVAGKIFAALTGNTDVTNFFNVTNTGADVIVERNAAVANDPDLKVTIDSCTCTGVNSPVESANNIPGAAPGQQVETVTVTGAPVIQDGSIRVIVTAAALGGLSPKTIPVSLTVAVDTTNDQVATDIASALNGDPDVGPLFTATTQATGKVVLTRNVSAADDPTLHMSIRSTTGVNSAESVNTAPGGTSATPNDIGGTVAGTFNLIGDTATAGGLTDGSGNNLVGNAGVGTRDVTTVLDTNLADNGGPTRTHKLVNSGPAIDAGNKFTMTTDQRGLQRPVDLAPADASDGSDIGAYEVQGPTPVPTLTLTSANSGGTTRDSTPDFQAGNLITGATVELLRGGVSTTPATIVTATGSTMTLTDNTLTTDGTYAYSVKQTVGGDSQTSTPDVSVTVDTRPTVTALFSADDTGASNSDKITKITTPRFTGTADPNTSILLFADNGGGAVQVGTGSSDAGGAWTITSSALVDGTYSITAKEVFGSFVGAASTPLTGVVIDTQVAAPSTPVLFAADDTGTTGDNITNINTPRLTGTAEGGSSVTLFSGVNPIGTGPATGGNWTITVAPALPDNTYQVTAQATDIAGNVSALSGTLNNLVIDTQAPAAPSQPDLITADDSGAFNNDNITNKTTPTFTGTAEANSTVKLYANNGGGDVEVGSATATGGNWSITSSILAANNYQITAKATDVSGNTSIASTVLNVTIDDQAPNQPSLPDLIAADDTGISSTDNITKKTTPAFTGTAEANGTVQLFADSGGGTVQVGSGPVDGLGNWSVVSSALADGTYQITVKATDLAGNQSVASTNLQVVIDTQPPTAPSTPVLNSADDTGTSNSDGITKKNNPNFTGTAEAGSTVQLFAGATPVGSGVATGGNWSITSSVLADNSYNMTAQATDLAGNTSPASAPPFALVVDTVRPTVTMSSGVGNPTATTPIPVTVLFSEPVTGFVAGDVVVSNASSPVTNFTGSNANYSFDLTPTAAGGVSADIAGDAASDTAGNGNQAAAQFNRTFDPSALSVSITPVAPDPRNATVPSIQIVFNKAVTGFDLSDLTLKLNAGANLLTGAQTLTTGDNITWTLGNLAGLTGAEGTYELKLTAAGSGIIDSASTPLASDATETWLMDTTPPNVTVTVAVGQANPVTGPTSSTIINFTVVFGEAVANFTSPDVTLSGSAGATVANVSGSGTTYNVGVEGMTASGAVTITIAAGVATDAAGNGNTSVNPTNTATVTFNVDNFTTFEVNTTADTDDGACSPLGTGPGNQDCTLREAINAANTDNGAETITFNTTVFAAPGPYTINLGSALADLTTSMTITGPGANVLTVKRNVAGNFRIFLARGGATVNISGLTMNNGRELDGAGMKVGFNGVDTATVTLTRVAVTGNTAIDAGGGGGLLVAQGSTLNLIESTVSGNQAIFAAAPGGGIFNNDGVLTVTNSTISGNSTTSANGGGIFAIDPITISNSTITNNTAGGGGGGGGVGLSVAGTVATIRNTIIAGNFAAGGPDVFNNAPASFSSEGYNLIQNTSGATINETLNPGTNITGQPALLNPLGDNGGPTQTHSLQCTSPGIDKGKAFTVTTDQRGGTRPFDFADGVFPNAAGGDGSDIGAVETQSGGGCLPTAVPPSPDPSTNEDTAVVITLTGTYSQNFPLTFTITQQPGHAAALTPSAPNCVFTLSMTCTSTVTYTPNANFNGADLFKFKVSAGGLDSDIADVNVTVNPINDAPTFFNSASDTVAEDAGAQSVANFANTILAGPADESAQTLQFQTTGNTNPGLFLVAPTIDPSGTLTYTPQNNAHGSSTITVVLKDNGGTASGGVDTSTSHNFTITVTPVADTPSVTNATTLEDIQTTSGLVISRNPADGAEVTHFMISNITNGSLYKNDGTTQINNGTFITFAEGNAGLKFSPANNLFSPSTSFSFQVQAATNNAGAGLSSGLATATITVTPVNDPPTFDKGPDQTVVVNAGAQVVPSWATNIVEGQADESGQALTFEVTGNTNTALFSAQPAVGADGTLTYTPATNISGTATITLRLKDDGGTANGGIDVSPTQSFTITVNCGPTVVTNSNDSGAGSLRDVILHACAGSTITFDMTPGQVTSPITLTTGELIINKNLTISGPGANLLTISGNNASRIFNVGLFTVAINGLTIANGRVNTATSQGGAILNGGALTITRSTLSGNSANGSASNFGGAIYTDTNGNLTIIESTLSGNSATGGSSQNWGGAIKSDGILTIINSTLSGNSVSGGGSGGNFGGAIFTLHAGAVRITNCTISGNSANGATGFGGGVDGSGSPVKVRNTIIAGNTATLAPDVAHAFSSQGNNLIGMNDDSTGFTNGVNGDKVGTVASPLNALLAPLANYGGSTQTFALLPGSPAIDAGNNCVADAAHCGDALLPQLTTDQRGAGFNRTVNGTVDIGAFESRGFTIAVGGGSGQSTVITTAFASPLVATVTSGNGEPVNGGVVTFTAPSSGASATFTGGGITFNASINAGGQASASPVANALAGGPYNVTGTGSGIGATALFALTNTKAATTTAVSSSSNPSDLSTSVTFTATVTSAAGTPTGTVQFKDNGSNIGSPVALNGSGVAQVTTSSLTAGTHTITAEYSGDANFLASTGTLPGGQVVNNKALISFSASNYNVNEIDGIVQVVVNRTGDTAPAVNIDYATDDTGASTNCAALNTGLASQRCDYTTMLGTLKFAAGETQKTIGIPINLDAYTEGPETFTVLLTNPIGSALLILPSTATVTISDSVSPAPNPIDDTTNFVRQQYRDFLNRDADPSGLAFWIDNIDKCNDPARRPAGQTLAQCIEVQRITTSAAFFFSIEFKQTGGMVRDFYVAALDRPATNNMPSYIEFMRDTQAILRGVVVGQGNWQQVLDANRIAFMNEFVMRAEFVGLYPTTDTPTQYVDKLYLHANVAPGTVQERLDAILEFGGAPTAADPGARGRALLRITQNAAFQAREANRTFVQIEYFGYLRRDPDLAGYNFWVNKLNQFNGDFLQAEMVKAFLSSIEYRSRFGP